MASKFDRIRAGEVVEVEPGVKGRLNFEDKTLEMSNGMKMYVGDDEDFFPSSAENLNVSREKEAVERSISKVPAGEFLFQLGQQGAFGALKDWGNKFLQSKEEFNRGKKVHEEISNRISQRSPYVSGAATAASIGTDIALTRGMSGLKAAPTLAAIHAGPRILEEPGKVAGEAAMAAGGGFLLDKGASFLSRIAQRRAASKALPAQREAVRARNVAGKEAVESENLLGMNKYAKEAERVANENVALQHQHNLELNDRQNRMIQTQNDYEKAKALRAHGKEVADAEMKRLQAEYKLAKDEYDQAIKMMPESQRAAQISHGKQVVSEANKLQKSFPKDANIATDWLDTAGFIDSNIRKSGLAGTREGNQAAKIIQSIFPKGEAIGAKELTKRYQALEDSIARSSPEIQRVLSDFKVHLGQKLPGVLEDVLVYRKVVPTIEKGMAKDVDAILSNMRSIDPKVAPIIKSKVVEAFKGIDPKDFAARLRSGRFKEELVEKLSEIDNFLPGFSKDEISKIMNPKSKHEYKKAFQGVISKAEEEQRAFIDALSNRLDAKLAKAEVAGTKAAQGSVDKLGQNLQKTYGIAAPISEPVAPIPPSQTAMPSSPLLPPETPPMPQKPIFMGEPTPHTAQRFTPEEMPVLSSPSGVAERAGDFLEQQNLLGGKTLVNNPISKLAGLKFVLGKAALPAELGYMAMKGLTSPTAAGEVARASFKQAGIQAIEQLAQKYPSYNNGVLEDPQERRSLTKEIEMDNEIPMEEKAIIQSKVNRGLPLSERLR